MWYLGSLPSLFSVNFSVVSYFIFIPISCIMNP